MFDNNLQYHIFKDYGLTFDEKGNTCGTLRKVQWVREGKEPDEEKAKIEIRHAIVKEDGETVGKGYSFAIFQHCQQCKSHGRQYFIQQWYE